MKCPVCKEVTLLMMDKNGIEIDYCPECRGVWLDRGELEKLIQGEKVYTRQNYEEPISHNNDGGDRNDSNHQDNYRQKKKKGFLEAFDFFD